MFLRIMTHRDDPIDAYPFENERVDLASLVQHENVSADLLRIRYIPEGELAKLPSCFREQSRVKKHVSHVIEPVGEWSLKKLSKATRRGIVRDRKAISELGEVTVEEISDAQERDAAVTKLLDLKSDWLQQKGNFLIYGFSDPVFHNQLRDETDEAPDFKRHIFVLKLDGRPIAYELCIMKQGRLMSVIAGYEPEFARYGPGRLLTVEIIQFASELGAKSYDLLPPSSAFKNSMTKQVREYYDLMIPKTMRGRVALALYGLTKRTLSVRSGSK